MKNSSFNIAALKADNRKTFAGMLRLILLPLVLFVSGVFFVAEAQVVVGNSQSNQTTSTSLTITKPTDLQLGDLMIVNLNMRKGATVPTALAGFTERVKYNHATPDRYVWIGFKVANATDVLVSTTGYTFQNTGDGNSLDHWAGAITAFRNVNTTTNGGIEVVGTHYAADNSNPLAPTSINTVSNNDMVVFMGQVQEINFVTTNPTTTGAWRLGGAAGTVMTQLYLVNPTGSGAICGVGAASLTRPTAGASGAGYKTTDNGRKAGILLGLKAITCAVSATVAKTDVTCFGTNNGTITLSSPTGGTAPYQYRLGTGVWQSSGSFTGLGPGVYSVQVRDVNEVTCTLLATQTITEPAVLSATVAKTDVTTCTANGTITFSSPTGGGASDGVYEYQVNSSAWQTSASFANLTAGSYIPRIRRAGNTNCVVSFSSVTINALTGTDTDGDGIINTCDSDDDNDGILDIVECPVPVSFDINAQLPAFTSAGQTGNVGDVAIHSNVATINGQSVDLKITVTANSKPTQMAVLLSGIINNEGNLVPIRLNDPANALAVDGLATLRFDFLISGTNTPISVASKFTWRDIDFISGSGTESIQFITNQLAAYSFNTPTNMAVNNSGGTVTFTSNLNGGPDDKNLMVETELLNLSSFTAVFRSRNSVTGYFFKTDVLTNPVRTVLNSFACPDTDGDGTPNSLDTDSDNDLCFDAIEGSANFTLANLSNGRLTGAIDANGVPTISGSPQTAGSSTVATTLAVDAAPVNRTVAAPAATTFSITTTASNHTGYTSGTPVYNTTGNANAQTVYQWFLGDPDNGGTALTNTGVYTGATSATLNISNTTGLFGNVYYVRVTQSNNECIREVRSASLLNACATIGGSITSQTDVLCFGLSTGAFTVTGSGGTAPYQYSLNGGSYSGTNVFTGRAAGPYTVTVRDANQCTSAVNVTITQPASALTGTISSQTNVLCFGQSTGVVTVVGSGGTGPYTYKIGAGAYSSVNTFTGLAVGPHTVTVQDASLCTTVVNVTITQPASSVAVTPTVTQPSCFAFGAITLSPTGGTAPYTYDWADVSGTNNPKDRSGLAPGNYSVVVSDANGCTISSGTITLTAPTGCAPVTVCKSGGPASVFSVDPDPSITTYTWTVPSGAIITAGQGTNQITVNWSGVTSGTYPVCVTAANACGTTASTCQDVNVVNPPTATATASAACEGSNIQLNAGGGATYQWSGPGGFASSTANPIIPNATPANNGLYTVTVTNTNGCSATASVNVTVAPAPSITGVVTLSGCDNPVGAINITVSPTDTYTYLWSNGATTEDISNLASGVYSVTATSTTTGCTAFEAFAVNAVNTPGPTTTATPANISCFGGNNGSITNVSVSGGTPGYTYSWTRVPNGFASSDANITNLTAGTYKLVVTDAEGCKGGYTATITEPDEININYTRVNVECFGAATGNIDLTVSGGTGAYNYSWKRNNVSYGGNTQDLPLLTAGVYEVTVTDANNCSKVETITITGPASAVSATTTITNVSCFGGTNGQVVLTPTGGTAPYTYAWSGPGFSATTKDISNRTAGTYSVTITDAKGCTFELNNIIINQSPVLTVSTVTNTPVSCFGGNNGAIEVLPAGGSAPYSYQWSNGGTTAQITGLFAGPYSVTVTDEFGCSVTSATIIVTQPAAELTVSATPVAVSCFGASNGSVTTVVNGGTSTYTYLWNTNATDANLTNVVAGNYQVTVTDAKGCTATATATINSPEDIVLSGSVTNITCSGVSSGAISLTVTGGTALYSYDWADLSGTDNPKDRSGLAAGTYSVTVTDANGCTDTKSYVVTESSPIVGTMINSNISCFGGSDGAIDLTVVGGVGPYTYIWNNGAVTEDITGLVAGFYTVTIKDANNCEKVVVSNEVIQTLQLSIVAIVNKNVNCKDGADGGATALPSGGTAPYTYDWSDGGTGAVRNDLSAGTYTINITDSKGCTAFNTVTITEPDEIMLFAETTNASACSAASGAIVLTVDGGTAPYTYAWTRASGGFSATTKDISGLVGDTYTVTVTDNNGCTKQLITTVGTEISTLTVSVTKSDITCLGFPANNNGVVFATPEDGIPGYTYLWNNGATTSSITNLGPGTYSVTVTDAGGCTAIGSATLVAATCIPPSAVGETIKVCNADPITGDVSTNDNIQGFPLNQMLYEVQGAPAPSEGVLEWGANFDGTFKFTPHPTFSGTVVIPYIVEDPYGLSDEAELIITVSRLDLLLSGAVIVNANCGTLGTITIPEPTSGGTAPYEYSLNNVDFQTSNVFNNLAAGNYTVYVKDANNCNASAPVTIANDCPGYLITGIVRNDTDGLTNNTVDGDGTNAGGLNAVLVSGGSVVAVVPVNTDGTFSFNGVTDGTYSIQLNTTMPTLGQPAPAVSLPLGWVSTGEFLGTGVGNDGLPANSILSVTVAGAPVTDAQFGIQQPLFTTDPSINSTCIDDAPFLSYSLTTNFNPAGRQLNITWTRSGNTTGLEGMLPGVSPINQVVHTLASIPVGSVTNNGNGTWTTTGTDIWPGAVLDGSNNIIDWPGWVFEGGLWLYKEDGYGQYRNGPGVGFSINPERNAATPAAYPPPTPSCNSNPPVLIVSGNVFNDTNGGTVDGTGSNAGATHVSIVSGGTVTSNGNGTSTVTGGTILTTVPVNGDGSYSITGLIPGTYNIVLHTSAGGSLTTAVNAGWVNTGEGIGATPTTTDGLINGITEVGITNANVQNVNFGIQQPPYAGGGTNNASNRGGTQQVIVPANTFTRGDGVTANPSTDPTPGTLTSIRIVAFPTGATTIVINGTRYSATGSGTGNTAWPAGGIIVPVNTDGTPSQVITVDPASSGNTTVTIPFRSIDNAGMESLNIGNAILILTATPDLSPSIVLPSNTFNIGETKDAQLNVTDISMAPTVAGTATFSVTIPSGYIMEAYNNTLTTFTPSGGSSTAVNNTQFSEFSRFGNTIIFRANAGVIIPGLTLIKLGIRVTRTTANSGSVSRMTIGISNDATRVNYDSNTSNNTFTRILNAQQPQ